MDQTALRRALGKTIAFKQCGKDDQAAEWARTLIGLLERDILRPAGSPREALTND